VAGFVNQLLHSVIKVVCYKYPAIGAWKSEFYYFCVPAETLAKAGKRVP
jgi:hypothetical protein